MESKYFVTEGKTVLTDAIKSELGKSAVRLKMNPYFISA